MRNGAHKAIVKSIAEHIDKFPEIFEYFPISDSETIKEAMMGGRGGGASPPSTGKGIGISKDIGNTVNTDTPQNESLIARLYKYFVGEDNLTGQGITGGTRRILAEAIHVMDIEDWKVYCDARLVDEYKASPNKFFLEDGWRRYQEEVKSKDKEKKQAESRRIETKKRSSLPQEEAPTEFKEFVKNFGKRPREAETTSSST